MEDEEEEEEEEEEEDRLSTDSSSSSHPPQTLTDSSIILTDSSSSSPPPPKLMHHRTEAHASSPTHAPPPTLFIIFLTHLRRPAPFIRHPSTICRFCIWPLVEEPKREREKWRRFLKLHLAIQRSERRSSKPSALSATPLTKALVTSKVFTFF
ncbi:hypothetical protein CMV_009703 [Castanea mollissima]|uniref:Uncharacterized protein n=1 Tax=Castanea mollissima TaxID=60419 RepID=A0A8J4RJV6_9ROSI|nr:hypothetical protein CMV_009703 [Castanea mollissima]